MTLKIELIDPENETAKTLTALAAFLNTMAGVAPAQAVTVIHAADSKTVVEPGNAQPDAPFVSTGTTPPPPPVAPAQQESTTGDGAELDKNGLPWDARIHASTKGKNQDGTWKALRGVDKSIVPGIEAELRERVAATVGNDAPPPPPAVATTSTNAPAGAGDVPPPPPPVAQAPAADAPPPPPPPVVDAAPAAPAGVTAGDVFKRINELRKGGHADLLPQPQLDMALMSVGLGTLPDFMKEVKVKPELAASFLEAINAAALPEAE